ncbi:MAG: response regulator transcription factor [Bacillota bacterium]|nr:response regulator transcription factor [Bacillota bacterium]
MSKVLVVEDDDSIRSVINLNLKRNSYHPVCVGSAEEALRAIEENEDIKIMLLDIMLPGMSGLELCEYVRKANPSVGIILLTAKVQEADKIIGLEKGADDYLTKPFSPAELIARVNALYRRIDVVEKNKIEEIIESADFVLNISTRTCYKSDREIVLTPTEFMIVKLFFSNEGKILSREDILKKIWGENFYGDMKIVDVNIRRLRRKLEDDASNPRHILTVWAKGYKWVSGDE